jgi:anaerobic magnesium-protoporphyrin IX monomethyl ester cyclase
MKILLINPPAVDNIVADMSDFFDESSGLYPPVGLMYLASYLRKTTSHQVEILDANALGLEYDEIREKVETEKPDLVGITMITFNAPSVLRIAADVKEVNKRIVTVIGGPHATIFPNETLAFPQVDHVVVGEGEIVLERLLNALATGASLDGIGSLGFKRDGKAVLDKELKFIDDLDALPFPAVDLIEPGRYFSVLSTGAHTMVMMSSRGCPFNCIYCDRPHLGRKFRARSPANVVDEMELYSTRYGIDDIKFFDDTFTVKRKRVVDICDEIKRRNLKLTWGVRSRVNTVDYELLKTMEDAGLTSISFGIESGNQRILDNLQKGITLEQVVDAVSNCKRLGIETLGDFIIGNPGEKKEEIKETIRFAKRLKLDYAQFTVMTPYPSTQLYSMGLEKNIVKSDYWTEFAKAPVKTFVTPVWEEFYSKKELVGWLKKAYRSFYFRPSYMIRRAFRIRSLGELERKLGTFFRLLRLNSTSKRRLAANFKRRPE